MSTNKQETGSINIHLNVIQRHAALIQEKLQLPKWKPADVYKQKKTDEVTCYACQQKGHYANKCPNKTSSTGSPMDEVTCYACQQKGHYANKCPNKTSDDVAPQPSSPITTEPPSPPSMHSLVDDFMQDMEPSTSNSTPVQKALRKRKMSDTHDKKTKRSRAQ